MLAPQTLAPVFPVFPLAALPSAPATTSTTAFQLAANPHQGVRNSVAKWQLGLLPGNPQKALGMPVCLYDSGRRSRDSGKERDAETNLDFFDVRYLSGAQGRFTSPDEPLTFADPENPQTWNLYAYGLNNPLLYSDPSGHDPCVNSVNPQTGNMCTTGTSTAPGLDPIQELILGRLTNTLVTMNQAAEKTQQLAQPVLDWLSQPRNQNCLNAATASGVAAGATYGLLSAAGGPTVLIGDPAAAGIGGGIGWVGGMFSCTTGSGGGGGNSTASQSSNQGFWKGLKPFRGKTKTNGLSGKDKRFFEWDHTHGDVEVYDARGNHLGSANPDSGAMTKPAVPGRRITI